MIPDETRRFLEDERHHLLLGYVDDLPEGFLSAVEVFHPDKRGELFLNEVAVMEEARRLGVARALVDELKRIGHGRGCVSMWGLHGRGNAAVMRLYRTTGGVWNGESAVMFEYALDEE